jgi:hypothetical protein
MFPRVSLTMNEVLEQLSPRDMLVALSWENRWTVQETPPRLKILPPFRQEHLLKASLEGYQTRLEASLVAWQIQLEKELFRTGSILEWRQFYRYEDVSGNFECERSNPFLLLHCPGSVLGVMFGNVTSLGFSQNHDVFSETDRVLSSCPGEYGWLVATVTWLMSLPSSK